MTLDDARARVERMIKEHDRWATICSDVAVEDIDNGEIASACGNSATNAARAALDAAALRLLLDALAETGDALATQCRSDLQGQ